MILGTSHLYFESGNFDYIDIQGNAPHTFILTGGTYNHDITDKGDPAKTANSPWFDRDIYEVVQVGSRWALVPKA